MEDKIGVIIWAVAGGIFLAYRMFIALLVSRDTNRRRACIIGWSIGTFLLGFVIAIPYLLVRRDISEAETKEP